jgi:hypothetical protein
MSIPKKATRKTVCLVACGKSKRGHSSPAKDMYLGDLFKKSRAWAERNADEWAILSAKHFLLEPEKVIEPYEQRMPTNIADQRRWARMVNDAVVQRWCQAGFHTPRQDEYGGRPVEWDPNRAGMPKIIVLAGKDYRTAFEGEFVESGYCLRMTIDVPMQGMEIGEQLSWLKKELAIDTASSP